MSRLRANPLTLTYLLLLIAATATVRSLPTTTQAALLQDSSTDVVHLVHTPLRVLVASAFWLPTTSWLLWLGLLLVVLGSLERRVGVLRTFQIFVSGHVLATLATELPIAWMIYAHLLPASAAERPDVGVSYGFFTAVGAIAGLLDRRARSATLAVATTFLAICLIVDHDMTTIGHVISLACGIAWWPALQRDHEPGGPWAGQTLSAQIRAHCRDSAPAGPGFGHAVWARARGRRTERQRGRAWGSGVSVVHVVGWRRFWSPQPSFHSPRLRPLQRLPAPATVGPAAEALHCSRR